MSKEQDDFKKTIHELGITDIHFTLPNGKGVDLLCPEKFTWVQLAEAIMKLPDEERLKQAYISIDDDGRFTKIAGLEVIENDVYVNTDNEDDAGSLEDLKSAHGEDFIEGDYVLATPKGTAFLYNEF